MNRILTRRAIGTLAALAIVASAGMLVAGPLTPPGGPVASTYKTLNEIEPRIAINATNTPGGQYGVHRITQPGSYYLVGNITVPSGKNGVEITASGVTLDLNGYSIQGQAGSLNGISNGGGAAISRIRITNGTIEGMGFGGIQIPTFSPTAAQNVAIERLIIRHCDGIGAYFNDGTARDCQFMENTSMGLYCHAWFDSTVEGCTSTGNGSTGIRVSRGTVRGCSASQNTESGIMSLSGIVEHCGAHDNGVGITGAHTLITGCEVSGSTQVGIRVSANGVVRDNSVCADSVITGSIGIQIQSGVGSRIEGNNITRQATGIVCPNAGNLVIGNTFSQNTNAVNIAAGNRVGPILVGTFGAAINGNSGGGLGFTDPNANIIY